MTHGSRGRAIKDSQFGKVSNARKGSAIIVFDVEGTAVKRYNLINARLKTLERGSLKAGDTSVLTEKLILTHEGYEADEAWHSGYEAAMCCQVPDGHDLCSDSVGGGVAWP